MKDLRQGLPTGSTVVFLAVILGATLRFTGIGWGLQHPAHSDEQAYIESVNAMLDAGDLDHRYYYYPGLFFYLLAPILDALGESRRHGPEGYLAGRVLIATVASLNIWIASLVARSFGGPWAAAGAALALAVSPLSSSVAHEVRPDLIFESLGLLSLLFYSRETWKGREVVTAGLLAGLASAIKFSGFLFLSGIAVAAWIRRAGFARLAGAALLTGLLVLVATPYALVHTDAYLGGRSELHVYFQGLTVRGFLNNLFAYGSAAFSFGGLLGAAMVLYGAATLGKARSPFIPWLAHFVVTLIAFSMASLVFPRHLLQVTGGLCVLFGLGFAKIASRSPALAIILLAIALANPLAVTTDATLAQAVPSAPDRAKEWIDKNLPDGAVVLETRRDAALGARAGASVGVNRSRFEFVTPENPVRAELRLLMPHSDLVVVDADRSTTGSLFAGSKVAYEALGARGGRVLSLLIPGERHQTIPAAPDEWSSSNPDQTRALVDGEFRTVWSSPGPMNGSEWMEFQFREPRRLCRVELDMPLAAHDHEPEIAVLIGASGAAAPREVRTASLRPTREDQVTYGRPRGQTLVFEPELASRVRIEQRGVRTDFLQISEVRLSACP